MILLAGVISFTSCSDDDPTYTAPAELSLKSADAFFEAAGGTGSIVVNSAESITATSNAEWLKAAVNGNTVTLTVAANDKLEGRSTNVVLKSATAVKEVNVTQRGIIYGLADGYVYRVADTANSQVSVPVAQTAGATVSSLADWLTATFNSQTSMVEIVAASNDTESERAGLVAIQTGTVKDTIQIIQDAILFKLEKNAVTLPGEGGTQTVLIDHSRPVTATADADWITCVLNGTADTLAVSSMTRELGIFVPEINDMSLQRHISYNTDGAATDTAYICIISFRDDTDIQPKIDLIKDWLTKRAGATNINILVK